MATFLGVKFEVNPIVKVGPIGREAYADLEHCWHRGPRAPLDAPKIYESTVKSSVCRPRQTHRIADGLRKVSLRILYKWPGMKMEKGCGAC